MSVVYPADPEPAPPAKPSIIAEAQLHPVLAVVVIILGAVTLLLLINKLRGSSGSSSANQQPQVVTVPATGGTDSGGSPPSILGTVRASGQFPAWDAAHSGPPLRSGPGGSDPIIGYAPWGSSINLGTPINGESNQSGDPTAPGSTQWFPVLGGQGGYISRADLSAINQGAQSNTVEGTGSGAFSPVGWHGFLTHNLAGHDALDNGEHMVFNHGHHPRLAP